MPGIVSNTDSWKTYFYVLAEAIAKNAIDEAQARHNFMQYKLSTLFDTTPRGVESFSEDNFLTELRRLGLTPTDFPYDSTHNCYKIHFANHTFCLFCTEFITFFSQNAYHISTDANKDGSVNITSFPTEPTARILRQADGLYPEWEKQWPDTYRLATKVAKQFAIDSRTIDAIANSFLASCGKYNIEHHIGKSTLRAGGQSFCLDHSTFATDYAKIMGEIAVFMKERNQKC
ncbi:MAG: hypothetical protein J5542_06820 [Bacteroidales bacterium]|nr:hypothetical protein [Bacteroidales bacterium]